MGNIGILSIFGGKCNTTSKIIEEKKSAVYSFLGGTCPVRSVHKSTS